MQHAVDTAAGTTSAVNTSAEVVLCSTGLTASDRRLVEASARKLAPQVRFEGDLTDQTTHLIADRVTPRSAKLSCALRLGLPVVIPDWVHACAKMGGIIPLDESHMLPPLSGVVLRCASTSVSTSDIEAIKAAVEGAGGRYAGVDEACTHQLLASRCVNDVNSKHAYEGSQQPILVSPGWLRDSLRLGVAQDEKDYPVPIALTPRLIPRGCTPLGNATNRWNEISVHDQGKPETLLVHHESPAHRALHAASRAAQAATELTLASTVYSGNSAVSAGKAAEDPLQPSYRERQPAMGKNVDDPLEFLRDAVRTDKTLLKRDIINATSTRLCGQDIALDSSSKFFCSPPTGGAKSKVVYSWRELLFALQCAHLSHPNYFLECLRARVEPVVIKDKKVLLQVMDQSSAYQQNASSSVQLQAMNVLLAGPLQRATVDAMCSSTSSSDKNCATSCRPGETLGAVAAYAESRPQPAKMSATFESEGTPGNAELLRQLHNAALERERLNAQLEELTRKLQQERGFANDAARMIISAGSVDDGSSEVHNVPMFNTNGDADFLLNARTEDDVAIDTLATERGGAAEQCDYEGDEFF
ncbi:hypothetical protein AB1Y20_008716 [Prymnesium parvum]|uniref:BRCT domain-containing protein n=1 Tax=Prymnesium parvum TaxID=97485 RepID=A0AB34IT67_PRYPA